MDAEIPREPERLASQRQVPVAVFMWLVLLLIALGVLRSVIATRLDGFTMDEAYHIASGVSYVRYKDFRVNPEHPPLVKLWVGAVIAATGFHSDPLRQFTDKPDERDYTELEVFRENDPDSVQRRARVAMFVLNGLLLVALTISLRRIFDARVALGTLLFLVIDPTVAAHWPVVMTDLPVALLSATAIVLATRAFRDWKWPDLAACSIFLGLDLAAKHSAPVVFLSVAAIGTYLAFRRPLQPPFDSRIRKLAKIACVLAGAIVILWGFYFFRYAETRTGQEAFNRPLDDKINDVGTNYYHAVLAGMRATHIVPRAYLWGFADTVHAGMEGRPFPHLAFGRVYFGKAPRYFFPAMIAVKVPIGLSIMILLGLILFLARRLPPDWNLPATVILAAAILFLLVLSGGATYAGIRHALPVVVLLYIFAGLCAERALASRSRVLKIVVLAAFILACVSALPVMRPWEYFNELAGGTHNAYKYFNDEGVDLGQRTKEITSYYRQFLKPNGEIPDILYYFSSKELNARGIDFLGRDDQRDQEKISKPDRSGTIFMAPVDLMRKSYWDKPVYREAAPIARLGNVFVFSGTFHVPGQAAEALYWTGFEKVYTDNPDPAAAEESFRQSLELDPTAYFVHIELANLLLKRGAINEALQSYTNALNYAPNDKGNRGPIEGQIERITRDPHAKIPPLRNPHME